MTRSNPMTVSDFTDGSRKLADSTQRPESISSATMIFLRSARSARMPPKGENRIMGSIETAVIPANTDADPVCSRMYMDRANFKE